MNLQDVIEALLVTRVLKNDRDRSGSCWNPDKKYQEDPRLKLIRI